MSILPFIAALELLSEQSPVFYLLLDLGLKSSLLLLTIFSVDFLFRQLSASTRSSMWSLSFTTLLFVPVFHSFLPRLPISYTYSAITSSPANFNDSANSIMLSANSLAEVAQSLRWLPNAYFLVSFALALYLGIGVTRVLLLSRLSTPLINADIESLLKNLQEQNGIKSSVQLLVNSNVSSPLTWGVRKHKIIFPLDALHWDQQLLKQVISHELGHIERRDWVNQILSRLVTCIYWVNPLVWIAQMKFNIECEKACDDVAVDDTGCSIAYAENLLWLVNKLNRSNSSLATEFAGNSSSLVKRIRHILLSDKKRHYINRNSAIPGLIAAITLAAPIAALSISIYTIDTAEKGRVLIPVNYFPKNSVEFNQFQSELGKPNL